MLTITRRSLVAAASMLALSTAIACEAPVEAARFPADAVPFEPPAIYEEWWALAEACTGRTGAFTEVSWFHGAEPSGLVFNGQSVGGLYFADGHRILLDRQLMLRGEVVRHEMIHALAAPTGHPRQIFGERCAHLQRCIGCGLRESGRGVLAGAPEFNASVLEVTIAAEPDVISASARDRWYRLVVSARNTRAEDVWVTLPDDASFYWLEVGKFGSYAATDEPRWAFRAGETRRYTFDLRDTTGIYRFYGGFGGQRSDTISVNVVP